MTVNDDRGTLAVLSIQTIEAWKSLWTTKPQTPRQCHGTIRAKLDLPSKKEARQHAGQGGLGNALI
ncbi:MAG: hypothetical protein EOS61_00575 [Mesorhizobium sp.]|nr:MAG: hypothetical protein EOS61_00575 [Mesorhizobium sp.]